MIVLGESPAGMMHTPGPWFVGSSPSIDMDEESGEYGPDVYDSEVGVFAVIDGEPETVAQPYLEADACLIAAAPDMLAVLEELRESASYWSEYDVPLGIVERIESAIRKARGEE